jgi:HTH-type transcriptional regulator/antitoxin HipB
MKQQTITSIEILGQTLKAARHEKKLTQTELGNIVGLKQKTVSDAENGSPGMRIDTLYLLLSGLNLEIILQSRKKSDTAKGQW